MGLDCRGTGQPTSYVGKEMEKRVVMEVANSLGEGGGRVRCARRSRIKSILESMVD